MPVSVLEVSLDTYTSDNVLIFTIQMYRRVQIKVTLY